MGVLLRVAADRKRQKKKSCIANEAINQTTCASGFFSSQQGDQQTFNTRHTAQQNLRSEGERFGPLLVQSATPFGRASDDAP